MLTNSRSTTKCSNCKKLMKDNDTTAIGCENCRNWYHGACVSLTVADVKWLGSKPNVLWLCHTCLESSDYSPEAKLPCSFLTSNTDTINSCIIDVLPKTLHDTFPRVLAEIVETAMTESLPSYRVALVKAEICNKKMSFSLS